MNVEAYLSDFEDAYIGAMLWSSTDAEGNEFLDSEYDADDLSDELRSALHADCEAFVTANTADLAGIDSTQAGHDFALTRNRHGAGFWDRGLGEVGERLSEAARAYGESSWYVGDDGKVYA